MRHGLSILLGCCLSLTLWAQTGQRDSTMLRDFQFVKRSDPWLTGRNVAGLTHYHTQNIAEAEAYVSVASGRLADYYQSPEVLQAGAGVEAFCRINRRTVVYGQVSYDNFSGRDMTGSAFINPTRKPFDIVEDSLTNAGKKHRDTYQLKGAAAADLGKGFSIGLRLDYTAANYAKYKDLRHKNKLMDLVFSAGASWTPARWLTMGADYFYHRQTESVSFSLYGREDKVYKSMISYGPFIGKVEQLGNSGLTDKTREMPLVDDINGAGAQLSVDILPQLTFYNDFAYSHRKGYYGRRSPYTITYTRHASDSYQYRGQLTLTTRTARHALALNLDVENLENNMQSYRELRDPNDVTYYEYYDPVKTANRVWADWDVTYTGHFGILHELPAWTVTAAMVSHRRKQTAYFYPYLRRQDLRQTEWRLRGERNILLRGGKLSVAATVAFARGSGEPFEDDTLAQPSDKQKAPDSMDAFLYQEYHLMTAPQYTLGLQAKYAFRLPGAPLLAHVRGAVEHRKANTRYNDYCGRDRTSGTVAVGCTF